MVLRLTALASKEPGFAGHERILDGGALTIGRSLDTDWPLNDEERQVSKVHCRIESRNGTSELIDLSSNGVFFEGDAAPLGLGVRRPLRAGDVFLVGDYRFMVTDETAVAHPPLQSIDEAPTISEILGGSVEASEARASQAVSGDAPRWLGDVPRGAADTLLQTPFGWQEAPPGEQQVLPDDAALPLASRLSDEAEHIAATGGVMRVPGFQAALPDDWHLDTGGVEAAAPQQQPPQLPAADAVSPLVALLEAAEIKPARFHDEFPEPVLGCAGRLLRSLVDGLDRLGATVDAIEKDLGLAGGTVAADAHDLSELLDPKGDGDTEVARRADDLVKRVRTLAEALRAGAVTVGHHLKPESVERRARTGMLFPVWPAFRQACWHQYASDFRALSRAGDAEPADVVLGPVRTAFASISNRGSEGAP